MQQTVYVDPSFPDPFQSGTVYLYSDVPIQDASEGVDVSPYFIGTVQGTCTRTDPNPFDSFEYLGKALCQFNYEFFDDAILVASFTAEGPVENGYSSLLTVIGGLGELEGVSGEVYLEAAIVDETYSPPQAVADSLLDFLEEAEGYIMNAYLYTDPTRTPYVY